MDNTKYEIPNTQYAKRSTLPAVRSHPTNYNIFPNTLYFNKQTQFQKCKMNITIDMTSKYEILSAGSGQKTKPIQTQLKPKQTQ
jgi:hypothetical protein